jgi:hypothetical protein
MNWYVEAAQEETAWQRLKGLGKAQWVLTKAFGYTLAMLLLRHVELAEKAALFLRGMYQWTLTDTWALLDLAVDNLVKVPASAVLLGFFPTTPFPKGYPLLVAYLLARGAREPGNEQEKKDLMDRAAALTQKIMPSDFRKAMEIARGKDDAALV